MLVRTQPPAPRILGENEMPEQRQNFLDILGEVGQGVSVAIPIAGVLIPVITGVVKFIKSKINAQGDVEYTVIVTTGQAELKQSRVDFTDALDAINAERVRQGLEPFEVPSTDTET
jgi:hypothetical protein